MNQPNPFQKLPLITWGLIFIVASLVSMAVMNIIMPIEGTSNADRGQAFGRAVAGGLFFFIGIGLMVFQVNFFICVAVFVAYIPCALFIWKKIDTKRW